jgi:hypothetical protein
MKKITFLLLLIFGCSPFVKAQCAAAAAGFGNNSGVPSYNVQGMVQVVLNANNTVTVNLLSNFSTASGPDVRIFLVDRGTLTNTQLKVSSNFLGRPRIEMGLSPAAGAISFTKPIPAGLTITDFETVYFYCQAFNAFWDYGSYEPFAASNCALLETNNFEKNNVKVFPNPATNSLSIELDDTTSDYKVAVYNTLGSLVLESFNLLSKNNTVDISQLALGIYVVKITNAYDKVFEKKFIKK